MVIRLRAAFWAGVILWAGTAFGAITPAPGTVTTFPGTTSPPVSLSLTWTTPASTAGSGTIAITFGGSALPFGISTIPSPITYSWITNATSASTSLQFSVPAGVPPGSYTFALRDTSNNGAGGTNVTLIVATPSYTASVSPNPAALVIGGGPQSVTVSTKADPGFSAKQITYAFSGFPAFINTPAAQTTPTPYGPLTFNFSLGTGATPGTYSGTLTGTDELGNIKTFPNALTIVVQQPDITATFSSPVMNICQGGAAVSNAINLAPVNGYSGTPKLAFTSVPGGMTANLLAAPNLMPPGQSIPFNVSANPGVAPGSYPIVLNISDAAANINKNVSFTATVTAPDFTPSTNTTSLTLTAGGGGQPVTASITPNGCFTGSVNVTPAAPPGFTFAPTSGTAPATFFVQAAPNVAPGNYTATFTFTPPSGITKTTAVTITVVATPDFSLTVTPSSSTIVAGGSGQLTVSASAVNGFTGTISVTAPVIPGLTFDQTAFTLTPGASKIVNVSVASAMTPQTLTGAFTGTAAGISGTRSGAFSITVAAAPDFTLEVSPASIALAQSGSTNVTVTARGVNGFTGPITVTGIASSSVSVDPPSFTLVPGGSRTVTIAVAANAPLGSASVTFSGAGGGITHTATLGITISGVADFTIAATPPAIAVTAGDSGKVTVQIFPANGDSANVNVTSSAPPGVTLDPASFSLAPGASKDVQVLVSPAAAAGAGTIRFTGNGSPTHIADVLLTVRPPRPSITTVVPPAVATGDRSKVVRLLGQFFKPGAMVSAVNAGVHVESVNVISAQMADVTMSVDANAPVGATTLTLTNPDGGAASATLLVYPRGSIAAPLGVTTAAIVFPAEGTLIAPGQSVFPRGLLATTGTGTIIGTWKFDGVPFDRFTVNVGGGYPAEVRTHLPLPIAYAGGHTLELQIESPQIAAAPALHVIMAANSVSRLTLLAPRDGTVVGGRPPLFRWSLVPNSSGYIVELDDERMPRRFRMSEAKWRPSVQTLQSLRPGIHRWRVRAVFPGETEGEPTDWQRFAILPQHVDLTVTSGQGRVRWTGGVAGLLYRVEVLDAAGKTVYSALTTTNEFAIPPGIGGTSVRVTALGPRGISLGTSQSHATRSSTRSEIYPAQQKATVSGQEPANGSKVNTTQPHIAASWSNAVRKEDVSLILDETDVTNVATISPNSIAYDSLLPLAAGTHSVRLSLAGDVTTWSFDVEVPAEQAQAEAQAQPEQPAVQKDWAITPLGTMTVISGSTPGQPDSVRSQFSAQSDVASSANGMKVTGDTSLRHDLNDPNKTVQESRNWLSDFTRQQGAYQGEAKIGYAAPDFTDQSELLATGVARAGVEGRIHFFRMIASAYETFGTRPAGVLAGDFGPKQTIRAAALQTEPNDKWDFRLIGFRVNDEPGVTSPGGLGKAVGVFAKYVFNPKLTAIFEGSRGEFDPNIESGQQAHRGSALRLDLSGAAGTLSYVLNLRRTEADYINPANRGFTPGGVPDRTGANLTITKIIQQTSLTLQLRTLRDGNSSGAVLPRNRENGGTLAIATSFGQNTTLALGGNWTADHGSGAPALSLPDTDRTQSGANGTLTEVFGRFNLSQNLTVQKMHDRVTPISNQTTTAGTLTFGGTPTNNLNLAAVVSGTRSAGDAASVGTTDQWLMSLQPGYTFNGIGLMVQPRANYSRSKNDLTNFVTRTEQYQALFTWAPPRFAQIFSLQFSADASRNRATGQVEPAKFIRQYVGTLSLKWGAGSGASMNGTTVVNAQTDVAATKTNNPTTTAAQSQ